MWRRLLVPVPLLLAGLTVTVDGQRNPPSRAQSLQAPSQLAEAQSVLARGDSTKAIAILSDYLQAHPKDISARLGLARAYVIAEQNDKAEAEFQTILNVAPANISALAALAELYLHEGQLDKA
ncbi:MAG: tetratricopeptide repeat protein, partial [Acidobacteriia bacterium]|nr:tetratricopeptide repeat protein [Terriglobia bacterium]